LQPEADRHRSERAVGSGLGPAIVHELASAVRGSVQASSPDASGARFTLRLAIAARMPETASGRDRAL
jgi:signal transduction histidine kinase